MDWANTSARRDEKHLSFGIWRDLYSMFDGPALAEKSIPNFSIHKTRSKPDSDWLRYNLWWHLELKPWREFSSAIFGLYQSPLY